MGVRENPQGGYFPAMKLEPGTTVEYRDFKFSMKCVTLIKGVVIATARKGRVTTFGDGRVTSLRPEELKVAAPRTQEEVLESLKIAEESLLRVKDDFQYEWLVPHLNNTLKALQIELSYVR